MNFTLNKFSRNKPASKPVSDMEMFPFKKSKKQKGKRFSQIQTLVFLLQLNVAPHLYLGERRFTALQRSRSKHHHPHSTEISSQSLRGSSSLLTVTDLYIPQYHRHARGRGTSTHTLTDTHTHAKQLFSIFLTDLTSAPTHPGARKVTEK